MRSNTPGLTAGIARGLAAIRQGMRSIVRHLGHRLSTKTTA